MPGQRTLYHGNRTAAARFPAIGTSAKSTKVYARLVEDVAPPGGDVLETLKEVCASWISDSISNYNSDFFCQPRDYIRECYREGKVL